MRHRVQLQTEEDRSVHHDARNNTGMRLIVEQGITHDLLHGSVSAWRFLSANGVPEDLILRVLSDPSQRRASDTEVAQLQAVRRGAAFPNAPHWPLPSI